MNTTTTTSVAIPLVGAHYRPPAKAILQVLPQGAVLRLVPEPDNPFDENAIKVIVASAAIPEEQHATLRTLSGGYGFALDEILAKPEWHLGYIARGQAAILAPQMQGQVAEASLGFDAKGSPTVVLTEGAVQGGGAK